MLSFTEDITHLQKVEDNSVNLKLTWDLQTNAFPTGLSLRSLRGFPSGSPVSPAIRHIYIRLILQSVSLTKALAKIWS